MHQKRLFRARTWRNTTLVQGLVKSDTFLQVETGKVLINPISACIFGPQFQRYMIRNRKSPPAFSLPELLVVLAIMGILVLIALPNLMPLISRAKSAEAQQQLVFLHSLETSHYYSYSKYSENLDELGFEQRWGSPYDGWIAEYKSICRR